MGKTVSRKGRRIAGVNELAMKIYITFGATSGQARADYGGRR